MFEPSPCYAWNNTLNGAKLNMVLRPWANQEHEAKQAEHVKEGRDFFNEKPRPEYYRPYIYPHPLQAGWGASGKSAAASTSKDSGSTRARGLSADDVMTAEALGSELVVAAEWPVLASSVCDLCAFAVKTLGSTGILDRTACLVTRCGTVVLVSHGLRLAGWSLSLVVQSRSRV